MEEGTLTIAATANTRAGEWQEVSPRRTRLRQLWPAASRCRSAPVPPKSPPTSKEGLLQGCIWPRTKKARPQQVEVSSLLIAAVEARRLRPSLPPKIKPQTENINGKNQNANNIIAKQNSSPGSPPVRLPGSDYRQDRWPETSTNGTPGPPNGEGPDGIWRLGVASRTGSFEIPLLCRRSLAGPIPAPSKEQPIL